MKRMEVRCCCTPNKLLGTLPVPDATRVGDKVKSVVMKPRNTDFRVTGLAPVISYIEFNVETWASTRRDNTVHMDDCNIKQGTGYIRETGTALKHEGVTIEQLRLIPGFIEATPWT